MQQAGTRTQPDAAHLRILMLIYSTALEVTEPSAQFDPAMLAKSQQLQTVALVRTEFDPLSGWNQSLHIVLLLSFLVQSLVRARLC